MPLFKLPFEANLPISTPFAGHVQPPTARSAAGTWATVCEVVEEAVVALLPLPVAGTVVATGRRMTVVLLDEEGLLTTVVLPPRRY